MHSGGEAQRPRSRREAAPLTQSHGQDADFAAIDHPGILWMLPFALIGEVPTAIRRDSFALVYQHPMLFIGAGFSGFFVNITGFLIVKRTVRMPHACMPHAASPHRRMPHAASRLALPSRPPSRMRPAHGLPRSPPLSHACPPTHACTCVRACRAQ